MTKIDDATLIAPLETEAIVTGRNIRRRRLDPFRKPMTSVVRHTLLIALALGMLYPVIWMVVSSLRPNDEIFRDPGLMLRGLELSNYVDGASRRQQLFRITVPLLTPIIFFNAVLQLIGTFQSFTQAYIVSGGTGGPVDSTLFYTLYLYQQGFTNYNMGYASAMAWLLLVIVGILTVLMFWTSRFWVFYDDQD